MKINTEFLDNTNYYSTIKEKTNKYLIIHHTAGINSLEIWKWKTNIRASFHYLINKKGIIFYLLSDNLIAWHTWNSNIWPEEKTIFWRNLNPISIWIELENKGDGIDPYTEEQKQSLKDLTIYLVKKYNIENENILWHKEITTRKIDPSPNFWIWDINWFRKDIKNSIIPENKYLNLPGFEIFNNLNENGEVKKLIEIALFRLVEKAKNKTLKVR